MRCFICPNFWFFWCLVGWVIKSKTIINYMYALHDVSVYLNNLVIHSTCGASCFIRIDKSYPPSHGINDYYHIIYSALMLLICPECKIICQSSVFYAKRHTGCELARNCWTSQKQNNTIQSLSIEWPSLFAFEAESWTLVVSFVAKKNS